MKNILKAGFALVFLAFLSLSCKEDQIPTYSGPDAINIYAKTDYQSGTGYFTYDSLEMSFLSYPPSYVEHTFDLLVRIMGPSSQQPRTVKLGFGPSNTAVLGTDFTMATEATIPAGETEVVVPVTAYYHDGLSEQVTVDVIVERSSDFVAAVNNEVKFKFAAVFPENWVSTTGSTGAAEWFIGRCTPARYRWYYHVEGTIDLAKYASINYGWDYGVWMALRDKLNAAIDAYNAQFPDDPEKWLMDDGSNEGQLLRFG